MRERRPDKAGNIRRGHHGFIVNDIAPELFAVLNNFFSERVTKHGSITAGLVSKYARIPAVIALAAKRSVNLAAIFGRILFFEVESHMSVLFLKYLYVLPAAGAAVFT